MTTDHERLDALFTELVEASEAGVGNDVLGALWTRFTRGLLAHLDAEESTIFPALAARHPAEVAALRVEHDLLRNGLARLDVEVDLHLIRHPTVVELVRRLRDHAAREDETLYPWADDELESGPDRPALARLRHLLGRDGTTAT